MTPENSSSILTCCCYSLHICTPANADSSTEKKGGKGLESWTVGFSTCQEQLNEGRVAELQGAASRAHYQLSGVPISHAHA